MQGSWEAYRWDWAALAAIEHYKHGRTLDINLVLNAVTAGLLRLTLKYQSSEAGAAFKEAITSLNRAEEGAEAKGQDNKLDTTDLSKTLPASYSKWINFPLRKVSHRLHLLRCEHSYACSFSKPHCNA